jgi:hypothetical protein
MFFKKKSKDVPELNKTMKKVALALPRRITVQFEPDKMNAVELDEMLKNDISGTLLKAFPPANYYKNKKAGSNVKSTSTMNIPRYIYGSLLM